MSIVHITPAILPKTRDQLEEDFLTIAKLKPLPKKIHVDVADGTFVNSTTYPLQAEDVFSEFDCLPHGDKGDVPRAGYQFSVHCMVAHPERVVPVYIRGGASEIIIHIESFSSMELLEACCASWNVKGVHVVLAALLTTPISKLVECMERARVDKALLMAIHAGGQGRAFNRHVIPQIKELLRQYPSAHVAVDGGISIETIGDVLEAGAHECVVGSHILGASDPQQVYSMLLQIR